MPRVSRSAVDLAADALRELVRIPTVSSRDPTAADTEAFDRFLAELARRFPLLHERLDLTRVGRHALLLGWPGRGPAGPVVLMAHLDVVPAGDEDAWRFPPFSATAAEGRIWGRGTADDKGPLVAICAAVESLLASGFTPARDVWLSFGCDEEVSGTAAAEAVAALGRRGVRPWFVLDEGGAVATQALPAVAVPVAVVGVAEKGTTTLELRVDGPGGHASTPRRHGPTARLARAIVRLDRSPFPVRPADPTAQLLRRLTPHVPAPLRPVLARADRIGPLLARVLVAAGPETAAMTRTTAAVTTLAASPAVNVVAASARAGVSVRVMPGDSVASVVAHVRRVVRDDRVQVRVVEAGEPSPVSPYDDDAFRLVERVVGEVFPDAVAAPYVMMAATDARHFTRICERVYRFAPLRLDRSQRQAIHGVDENVGVADLRDAVRWYRRLLESLPG